MAMRKKFTLVTSLAFAAALCAGVGAANVQADAAANYNDFAITATAVRVADPSGLRFKVDCPTTEVENAYTVLTMTTAAGVSKTAEVPATVWRPDESGWNTVLLGIPDTDYVTEVTAQAFVTIGGVEYETTTVTSSIAKTASAALNAGLATESQVGQYVAGKVQSITLDQTAVTLTDDETVTFSATTAPAGYSVVWSSDNTDVATVDANGKVTSVGHGTANITASMGGASATCVVTAKQHLVADFNNTVAPDFIKPARTSTSTNANQSANLIDGYSGNTTTYWQKTAWINTSGTTAAAGDYAYTMQFQHRGTHFDLFGYSVAFFEEIFADASVGAITWQMNTNSDADTISTNVAEVTSAWQQMFTKNSWNTMTLTRAQFNAIKAQGKVWLTVTLTNSAGTNSVNWSSHLMVHHDDFKRVFNNEIEQPKVPLITDFSNKAIPVDSQGVPFVRPVYDRSTATDANAWKDAGAYGTNITCGYWQKTAWVGTTGETGAADDFGLFLQFENRSNSFALFGYSVSYLDEIFADSRVTAITWKMKVNQNASTIKIQSNVAAITTAWQASFTTSTEFQTMTITREMLQAAKDAGKTLIEVNFSPVGQSSWGAHLEIYQDNFMRVYAN